MHRFKLALLVTLLAGAATTALAQNIQPIITQAIDESQSITLEGNTPAAALDAANDRGAVSETMRLEHMLLVLKRPAESEAALQKLIDDMHNSAAPAAYHRWLTPRQLGARFGLAPQDLNVIQGWLKSHGFAVNRIYGSSLVIDFSGTAAQVRDALHTEIHSLVLPNGEHHIANVRDPQIPAALAPAIHGVASLHDFFPRSHAVHLGPVRYDHTTNTWKPLYDIKIGGGVYHTLGPYDLATIYDLLPLWREGFTGKGVTIAAVEDSNLLHPSDWQVFRQTFGLDQFTHGNFRQIYPGCKNPGQNGDETEAALDVEWSSAAAPDANIELSACANTATTAGLDLAILGLIDFAPPDIITDSYGLCETITGAAEIALENREAQLATAEGTTFFIAEGDDGADQCAPVEPTNYAILGINGGDNTASSYAVDVGGTDFMAQYNADVSGIPVSRYWSAKNNPTTKASALSYIPEIPWNDGCTSRLIYSDPQNGSYTHSYGLNGFCNSTLGQQFLFDVAGGGGPSTCFTGKPSIPGVVSGTCKGNPKPPYQYGVRGVPGDGLRDQPDISLFASNGVWGSFYLECMSDQSEGGAPCTLRNDAVVQGGGGTSFSAPAMAGIQALINQKFGRQGDANYVYYWLARWQFALPEAAACNASRTDGELPASYCIFHDITLGDMDIPCGQNPDGRFFNCFGAKGTDVFGELSTSNSQNDPAWPATVGYDLATGLGSVDATNLFNAWPHPW
ncbi:MAG TPA: protease pro-enzyme activation domain-containing protein [Steroidobacteraceae bacterium]